MDGLSNLTFTKYYFDNVTFQNLLPQSPQRGTKESKMLKPKVSFVPFVVKDFGFNLNVTLSNYLRWEDPVEHFGTILLYHLGG